LLTILVFVGVNLVNGDGGLRYYELGLA